MIVAKRKRKTVSRRKRSRLTKKEIYLDTHDEEKVLLFTTGTVFGIGMTTLVLNVYQYVGLSLLAFGAVLLLIEKRQK
jgi:hypothetical protein